MSDTKAQADLRCESTPFLDKLAGHLGVPAVYVQSYGSGGGHSMWAHAWVGRFVKSNRVEVADSHPGDPEANEAIVRLIAGDQLVIVSMSRARPDHVAALIRAFLRLPHPLSQAEVRSVEGLPE